MPSPMRHAEDRDPSEMSAQEPRHGLHEPLWIVEPRIVPASRLYGQRSLGEQPGILRGARRRERDVVLTRDEKDRRCKAGEGGSGGGWVESAGRVVDGCRLRILLARLLGVVSLG